jgi:hypothetical protein
MMHRRPTRPKRLATHFALTLTLGLVFGCGVEVVGVDRATIVAADARVDALDASVAHADDASTSSAEAASAPEEGGKGETSEDAASLASWFDPPRPAPVSGQFIGTRATCPALEPSAGTVCDRAGQQCDYPVCWGRGQRSWVCVEQQFTLWFDESFLCAATRPCPSPSPSAGAVCSLSIECVYPYWCCKGPEEGFQSARCDGHWRLGQPECVACNSTSP